MSPRLGLVTMLLAGCSGPLGHVEHTAAPAAATIAAIPVAPPAHAAPIAVVQSLPPPGWLRWQDGGAVLEVGAMDACDAALVDASSGMVTSHVEACPGTIESTREILPGTTNAGRYAASWKPGLVELRELATGALVLARPSNAGFAVSPNDAWLATTSPAIVPAEIVVWEIASGKEVARLPRLEAPAWSSDSAFLAASTQGPAGPLVVLETRSWTERVSRAGPWDKSAWSPAGARLAVASGKGVAIVDAQTGHELPLGPAQTVRLGSLGVTPDDAVIVPLPPRPRDALAPSTCEALRIEQRPTRALPLAAIVAVPCASADRAASVDGAWVTRRVSSVRWNALMMPPESLFVENTATQERWFVDRDLRRGNGEALWSARGHRLLVKNVQPIVYDADTHRVWKVDHGAMAWTFDADGKRLATQLADGSVQVRAIDARDDDRPAVVVRPATDAPLPASTTDLDADPWRSRAPRAQLPHLALAGDRLAAVTDGDRVTVWDLSRAAVIASFAPGFTPEQVAWVGNGALLALADAHHVRVSREDGSAPYGVVVLRTPTGTTWLGRASDGTMEGPPEAIAAVRWRREPEGAWFAEP